MSVYKNMAFALENMGLKPPTSTERVERAAAMLRLTDYLDRKPKALSGGQRQRVAIGRAIVRDPKIFLFDEPLSNLDAELRVAMRKELAALHAELGGTMIYVTHDQVEAMTLADRIVVLQGRPHRAGRHAARSLQPARQRLRRRLHRLAAHEPPAGDGDFRRRHAPRHHRRPRNRAAARGIRAHRRGGRDARHPPRAYRRRARDGHARRNRRPRRAARRRDLHLCHGARPAADHAAPGRPVAIVPRRCGRHPLRPRPPAPLRRNRRGHRADPDRS